MRRQSIQSFPRDVRRADAAFRRLIRHLYGGMCFRCHGPGCDVAHIIGRADYSYRWFCGNALYMCRLCHQWLDANKNNEEGMSWLKEHARLQYDVLTLDFKPPPFAGPHTMAQLISELKDVLASYGG